MEFDIIIVGASFAGLTLANSLQNSDMKIAIIEKKPSLINENPNKRTTAISAGNANFFIQKKIIHQDFFETHAGKINNIRIKEENNTAPINYCNMEHPMCYVIDNKLLLSALINNLTSNNIKFFTNQSFVDIESLSHVIKITLTNNDVLEAPLLIAADGKNSPIMQYYQLPYYKKYYHQKALVFNIHHEEEHHHNALEMFTQEGPFALLPTIDNHQSSVIWTMHEENADLHKNIAPSDLSYILADKINHYLGEININSEIAHYPLSLTYFKDYFHERVLFIGDALHAIHPIAGQGLNLTIADIKILSEILDEQYQVGGDLGSKIWLTHFKNRRKLKNWLMIQATDKLNSIYGNNNPIANIIKNIGSQLIDNVPFVKKSIIKYAMNIN